MPALLKPPLLADPEETRRARILFWLLWGFVAIATSAAIINTLVLPQHLLRWLPTAAMIDAALLGLLELNRRGRTRVASLLLVWMFLLLAINLCWTSGGIRSPSVHLLFVVVLVAGLLLGSRVGILAGVACCACSLGLVVAEDAGMLPASSVQHTSLTLWISISFGIAQLILLQHLTMRGLEQAFEATREELAHRNRAQEALRTSEARFRGIIETTREWIWAINTQGQHVYSNPAVRHILGRLPEEFADLGLDLMHPEDRREVETRFTDKVQRKEGWTGWVLRWRHQDGSYRFLESNAVPVLDQHGGLIGFQGTDRDITERKQAEEEQQRLQSLLIQAQKMEAVGQLAGGVAHDFNNILTAILMHLSLLQDDGQLPTEVRNGLKELEGEAKRAANLTRQLLLFSRRQALQPRPIDLNSLIGTLLKMLRRLIGENFTLEFNGTPGDLWLEADPGMLEQVVMNLVVNARDAMPKGGRVTLTTRALEINNTARLCNPEAHTGQFACLEVSDTGCGMDEATVKHIFEPFFTTKGVGKGTGLGLATVYGIVKQHQGWIDLETVVGQGTTFKVHLPANPRVSGIADEALLPESTKGGQESILLVEDEASVRRLALTTLQRLGYQVRAAANGPEALQAWEDLDRKVDLLVSDIVMPGGMNGLDLAERLRGDKSGLKLILMSGYSPDAANHELLKERGVYFLPKPIRSDVLARTIREALDGR